jgi:hypothetical protein
VYDLQGNLAKELTSDKYCEVLTYQAYPHWISIYNGKVLVTTTYAKGLIRLDSKNFKCRESIAIPFAITDDNTISKDGYVYINGEKSSFDISASNQNFKDKL